MEGRRMTMTHTAKLVSMTQGVGAMAGWSLEEIVIHNARVSNPKNQSNKDIARTLAYCVKHGHWSIFEQVSLSFEIETTRAIAPQILRHKSFSFSEYSQRYADVRELGDTTIEVVETRMQDAKNRQASHPCEDEKIRDAWEAIQRTAHQNAMQAYRWALENGIAKEQARSVLPMSTHTRLYMTGSLRSWIHWIQVRADPSTQKEHRIIAESVKKTLCELCPITAEALGWLP